jgi:hypothetical protein
MENNMSNHAMITQLLETYKKDYEKFEIGNKAAGTRCRKALSEISKLCKVIRQEIQATKNSDK